MGAVLVLLFIVVPLLEVYVIVQVGQEIGALPTVVLLLVESALGAWLVKREGGRAWLALRTGAASGRLPSGELADAALVLIGGTLLLAPGFITDIAGFLLVLPLTRPLARRLVAWYLARRATQVARHRPGTATTGRVVPGEVLRPGENGSGGSDNSGTTEDPGRAAGG